MANERRRTNLGKYSSAALPALWKAIAKRGWTHADFARHLAEALGKDKPPAGVAAKLLYGDFRVRDCEKCSPIAAFCSRELGVKTVLWTKPCPPNWKPHDYAALRPKNKGPKARESSPYPMLGATGTDD